MGDELTYGDISPEPAPIVMQTEKEIQYACGCKERKDRRDICNEHFKKGYFKGDPEKPLILYPHEPTKNQNVSV